MKPRLALSILVVLFVSCLASPLRSLATAFTYQGRLTDGGAPAAGSYDLRFVLYNAEAGGSQVGERLVLTGVTVEDGVFTVLLDFGAGVFDGTARWIEVAVRQAGAGNLTVLTPRQPVTPAPYAQFALTPAGPKRDQGDRFWRPQPGSSAILNCPVTKAPSVRTR
jgi:hypothetical protein